MFANSTVFVTQVSHHLYTKLFQFANLPNFLSAWCHQHSILTDQSWGCSASATDHTMRRIIMRGNESAMPQQQTKLPKVSTHEGGNAHFLVYGSFMLVIWKMWIIFYTIFTYTILWVPIDIENVTYYNANPNSNYSNISCVLYSIYKRQRTTPNGQEAL